MEYKRLKSGKNIPSEKAALLSVCAKEQIYGYVHNQFFETLKLPEECSEVSGEINKAGWMILRSTQEMNEYFEAVSGTENYKNQKTEEAVVMRNVMSIECKDDMVILTDLMERTVAIEGTLESANLVDGFVIVKENIA